jgi:NAD-dependent SIR2 family protein deacetylase
MPVTKVYCVKCKQSKEADCSPKQIQTSKGKRNMLVGKCPTCGTKVNKFTK